MSSKANRKDDINSNGKRTPTRNNEQKKSFRPYGHDLTPTPIGDRLLWSWIAENASIIQNVKVTKGPLERADPNAEAEEGCRIYIPITPLHDVHEDEVRNIFKRSVKFRDVVDINFHPKYNHVMIVFIKGLKAEDGPYPDLKFGFEGEPGAHVLVPRYAWKNLAISFEQYEQTVYGGAG